MRPRYVIIPAGGSGSRMGSEIPKQMLDLRGKPVLRRTVELFMDLPFKVGIVISINPSIKDMWMEYCRYNNFVFKSILTPGGLTRFHSVKRALSYLPDGGIVAVHDGVRPLMRKEDVAAIFEEAEEHPAVVPLMPVQDSMRRLVSDGVTEIVDREEYRLVQTPQVFHTEVLRKAYSQAFTPEFTDDASVVERTGVPLHFCAGSRLNIKLTTPEDMVLAGALIDSGCLR